MAAAASTGPRFAPEDPTLPKPWRGLVDGKTGYLYFWNPETKTTQYERPGAPPKPSSPISSPVQVQQSSQGQRRDYEPNEEDDRYGRGSNVGSKPATEAKSHESDRSETVHPQSGIVSAGNGGSSTSTRGHGCLAAGSGQSAESYRRCHEVTVSGDNVPSPFTSFESTGFPPELLREVQRAGFFAPTPIQAQSWPIALQSRDIVAVAKTGSGKTLGYLIPGFIHLKRSRNNPQMGPTVLVLSPTRELASQIQDEAVKFGKSSSISCTCLYGGAPKGPQLRDLERGADIVVATPGRLNDILEMERVSLRQVSYLVLDEADRMLDMGFEPQIREIVKEVPVQRQTLMYTATWPKEVRKIAADLLANPVQVNIGNIDELVANKSITQHIEVLSPMEKQRRLEQIIRSQQPGSKIIIFCSTKKMCDQLSHNISRLCGAAAIHGDKSQGERDYVLNQFRTGKCPVLVATDVAARGLDVKDIRVVVNYDFPTGVEDYVHRIGRTGRAGATGVAYTFFCDRDAKHASDLIKILEGANQRVPPEVREMASRGGGMGSFRRWGSGPSGRGGRNDGGHGGSDDERGGEWGIPPSSSSWHERAAGHGSGCESHDQGYNVNSTRVGELDRGRSRSRSPNKGQGWGRSLDWQDRVPPPRERSPVHSFHESAIKQAQAASVPQSPPRESYWSGGEREKLGGSFDDPPKEWGSPSGAGQDAGGYSNGPHSYFGEEEGIIPADEDGSMPPYESRIFQAIE